MLFFQKYCKSKYKMSFTDSKIDVEEGDIIILYLSITYVYTVKAVSTIINKNGEEVDNVFQTPFGALKCSEMIGKPFGSKVSLSRGFGYILQPNPELWTMTLPHRTQIIYTPDVGMIVFHLDIQPGSTVVECGTGSGALSHAFIQAIKPYGHLHTFDFHQSRVDVAVSEFASHGIGEYATVRHRDVCLHGFGDEIYGKADAVFLDLPHPWLAIPHTVNLFKETGGRLATFSPCLEQVQRTCIELKGAGFAELETMEILQTEYSVMPRQIPIMKLDFVHKKKDGTEKKGAGKEVITFAEGTPPPLTQGHTGYITVATFYDRSLRESIKALALVEDDDDDDDDEEMEDL